MSIDNLHSDEHPAPATLRAGSFPHRPVSVTRTGTGLPVFQLLLAVLMLAFAAGLGYLTWTSVAPDLAIRAHAVTVQDADVTGSCSVKKFAFADCKVSLTYSVDGEAHQVDREYMWVDLGRDEYTTDVVVSRTDPSLATASIALDKLPNRIATGAGLMLVLLGIAIALLRHYRRARLVRAVYATEQRLHFVPVEVVNVRDVVWRGREVQFRELDGRRRKHTTLFKKREGSPFQLPDGTALAVRVAGVAPILLDAGLTRLDVSDAERDEIAAAAVGFAELDVR